MRRKVVIKEQKIGTMSSDALTSLVQLPISCHFRPLTSSSASPYSSSCSFSPLTCCPHHPHQNLSQTGSLFYRRPCVAAEAPVFDPPPAGAVVPAGESRERIHHNQTIHCQITAIEELRGTGLLLPFFLAHAQHTPICRFVVFLERNQVEFEIFLGAILE